MIWLMRILWPVIQKFETYIIILIKYLFYNYMVRNTSIVKDIVDTYDAIYSFCTSLTELCDKYDIEDTVFEPSGPHGAAREAKSGYFIQTSDCKYTDLTTALTDSIGPSQVGSRSWAIRVRKNLDTDPNGQIFEFGVVTNSLVHIPGNAITIIDLNSGRHIYQQQPEQTESSFETRASAANILKPKHA